MRSVEFLGHIFDGNGVNLSERSVHGFQNWSDGGSSFRSSVSFLIEPVPEAHNVVADGQTMIFKLDCIASRMIQLSAFVVWRRSKMKILEIVMKKGVK